jgi:hypothetical protein
MVATHKDNMTDDVKDEVQAGEIQPEVEQDAVDQQSDSTRPDTNWQEARGVMASQKALIEAREAEIQALRAHLASVARAPTTAREEPDELDDLDESEVATVGQARKLASKLAKKEAKEIVEQYMTKHTLISDEERMRGENDDYDYVLENFAIPLIKKDPALARIVQTSRNPAQKAYQLGKLSDDYVEQSTKQQVSPKAQKILKNASRPVSANAIGAPLKNQAEDFSKLSAQDVWSMSQKYARGA